MSRFFAGSRKGMLPLVGVFVALAGLVSVSSALARDAADLTVSPTQPVAEKEYPGFLAQNAGASESAAARRASTCREAANQYCDTINLTLAVPPEYEYKFTLAFVISWENVTDLEDLDIWVSDASETELSGSSMATGANPERWQISNLDPDLYYIVVSNFSGFTESYKVRVELIRGEKKTTKKKPTPTPPPPPFGGGPTSPFSPTEPSEPGPDDSFFGPAPDLSSGEPFAPIRFDIPGEKESTGGFAPVPLAGSEDRPSTPIKWDGGRLMTGLAALAMIGITSYVLFFAPRQQARTKKRPVVAA